MNKQHKVRYLCSEMDETELAERIAYFGRPKDAWNHVEFSRLKDGGADAIDGDGLNIIDYIEGVKKVTPQILFNYGRDKKYVYGQIYYKVNPHTDEKKSFRFMIGKMDDNKSRKQLERICLDTFYDKIIIENVKL